VGGKRPRVHMLHPRATRHGAWPFVFSRRSLRESRITVEVSGYTLLHGMDATQMAAPAFWKKFWKEAGAAYGAVVPQCIMDKATGKSKGYGFVQFTTKQAARELIARKRIDVMGSMVRALAPH
jgi:hypothetical protein